MFGYVRINKMDLTFREYENYKAYYCGLCKCLKKNHTELSRMTLNYDITFLIVLLTSVYNPDTKIYEEGCIVNPIKKKKHISNEITEYAASMNILLSYYKILDNKMDEGTIKDNIMEKLYRASFKSAYDKYPEKAEKIKKNLDKLHKYELEGETNIDKVSNTFGYLMEELFIYRKDEHTDILGQIGFNIGKYIYILDAYEDLDKDLKSGAYNPFKDFSEDRETLKNRVDRLISMTLSRLERAVISLDLELNRSIIENILYSGIYLRYKGVLMGIDDKKNQT